MIGNADIIDDLPAHRWEEICLLLENKRSPSRREEDKLIRKGWFFMRRYQNATSVNKLDLRRDYPDIYWAHALYDNPQSERWFIEAGLLTDVSMDELAKYVGKPTGVVQMYADLYFDVRDKLEARGYILNRVLMPAYDRGLFSRDYDLLFKTMAYGHGWKVFTEFVDGRPLSDETRAKLKSSFNDRMTKLGWMAAHRIDVNNYNAVEIIEKCVRLQELEHMHGQAGARGEVMQLLGGLLDKCATTMLRSKEAVLIDEPRTGKASALKYGDPIPIKTAETANGKAQ